MKQEVSSPPPPTFNVDNQVIFTLFVEKNAIFSNIDKGDSRIRDTAQVSQLLLAGIVGSINTKTKVKKIIYRLNKKFRTYGVRLHVQIRFECLDIKHFKLLPVQPDFPLF